MLKTEYAGVGNRITSTRPSIPGDQSLRREEAFFWNLPQIVVELISTNLALLVDSDSNSTGGFQQIQPSHHAVQQRFLENRSPHKRRGKTERRIPGCS